MMSSSIRQMVADVEEMGTEKDTDWVDSQSFSQSYSIENEENQKQRYHEEEEHDKEIHVNHRPPPMYHTPNNHNSNNNMHTPLPSNNNKTKKIILNKKRAKTKKAYNLVANETPSLQTRQNDNDNHTTTTNNNYDDDNDNNNGNIDNKIRNRNANENFNVQSQLFQNINNNDENNNHQRKSTATTDRSNNNDDDEEADYVKEVVVRENGGGGDALDFYTKEEERLIEQFWKWYDDILFLSVFSILGVLFRLGSAKYVSVFGSNNTATSSDDAELFTTLPLNCLSCLIMGLLCSGKEAMHIIPRAWYYKRIVATRDNDNYDNDNSSSSSIPIQENENDKEFERLVGAEEQREVQLAALERRIIASKSLVLFPAKKQHSDVMEHYNYNNNFTANNNNNYNDRFDGRDNHNNNNNNNSNKQQQKAVPNKGVDTNKIITTDPSKLSHVTDSTDSTELTDESLVIPDGNDININNNNMNNNSNNMLEEAEAAFENLKVLMTRVNVADGWDVGTTPDDMSDDLLLGLRVGFCGALSTFASWNSDMVSLIREGKIRLTFTGYVLGLALPMFCYRLGQHMAIYIFIWRCHHETRRDEKRGGYGIHINPSSSDDNSSSHSSDNDSIDMDIHYSNTDMTNTHAASNHCTKKVHLTGINMTTSLSLNPPSRATATTSTTIDEASRRDTPSVRAIATAIAVMILVLLLSALIFFQGKTSVQRYCIALLFSPLGVLARWKICQKWNTKLPMFPLGTFACNILGCVLSGSLGSLLAGNPGPEESIVLVSMISGFAGSLSTLASFLVEVLNRIDPILFQLDGAQYALITIFWGMVIGLVTNQATNWADEL